MPEQPRYHLAYVFERFPTFTQTFCVREVRELEKQGLKPLVFSIRDTRDEDLEDHFPPALIDSVHFLPPSAELKSIVNAWKNDNALPQEAVLTLRHWGETHDKQRVYEAIYIGMKMREAGVRHAHSHFCRSRGSLLFLAQPFFQNLFLVHRACQRYFRADGFRSAVDDLMREAGVVVTVSDYTARWLKERFPACSAKVQRVYNGLDLAPFEAAAGFRHLEEGKASIVTVGRLIEKKGFDDLVRACALVKEKSDVPFVCTVVGDGPLEGELAALITELGVGDVVVLAGAKTQSEIIELLAGAQLFALPCVTEKGGGKDNLPTVIMEAMAARLPCVSTRLAGVPEMVIDGETGLLTEERQPEAFGEALVELLGDRERCLQMGVRGQERARRLFAKEVTAASLRDVLIARGCIPLDVAVVASKPGLLGSYIGQWGRRLARVFRRCGPSRFAQAERETRLAEGG